MKLSIIVVVYNMRREAPRTLLSLSPSYQRGIAAEDYEIIVVDNGSTEPLDPAAVKHLGANLQYHYIEKASPSPAAALNFGIRRARGELIGVMIDGARICTPGLLRSALTASTIFPRTVVATMGFYLGSGFQRFAIQNGYDKHEEDRLLASIGWPGDGYRLFEIGTADESSRFFVQLSESNALFLRRELWAELDGIDEQFDLAGGGLVNLDTYTRACELPGTELISLVGEATFHQVHGGVATNSAMEIFEPRFKLWMEQYRRLRGRDWDLSPKPRNYFGTIPESCRRHMVGELNMLIPGPYEEIAALREQIDRHRAETQAARCEREQLAGELAILTGSHSWRVTTPLRSAFRGLGALRKAISGNGNGHGNGHGSR